MAKTKPKILVVDDSELNRALLSDMLGDSFDIIEAENGREALEILYERELEISMMLLDIVMPVMDGFEVLAMMNKNGWIKTTPVIMISAETAGTYIDRAYDLGAIDYISRPFDERTVRHRVSSNYILTVKQKEMAELLSAQIVEKEKDNRLMIEILSHIVEFRNGESGLHVLHVHAITEMFLECLVRKSDKYKLDDKQIRLIANASALHDIGKISIPEEILNKPGRFTPEEFAIMKKHTVEGAKMLSDIPYRKEESLVKIGYQICRWHHERYDGKGYPDGLVGDEIPIAAQVVSIADVYDALTSKRVYKPAYAPDEAVQMILRGECGVFNPLLLDCLRDIAADLKREIGVRSFGRHISEDDIRNDVSQLLKAEGSDVSERTVRLLEHERMKFRFLADISREITFEYVPAPEMVLLSEWGAEMLGMPVKIVDPATNPLWARLMKKEDYEKFISHVKATTPEHSVVSEKYILQIDGLPKWCKIIAKAMWSDGENSMFEGAIGKIVDVNDEIEAMEQLEQQADCDSRTGLLNHNAAKRRITARLNERGDKKYALAVFDLDNFKKANDEFGHLFGDEVLEEVARRIRENIRSTDIGARMGGDEFMIFMEYRNKVEPQVARVYERLTGDFKGFHIGISMGVARAENFDGTYETLFKMADTAMYTIKRKAKNAYCVYDESMRKTLRDED